MAVTSRRSLLYISPIMPAPTGNGLAMRALMILEALAADYDVFLLVIPVAGTPPILDPIAVSRCCARVAVQDLTDRIDPLFHLIARVKDRRERLAARQSYPRPSLCRFATTRVVSEAAQAFPGVAFHEVHVFRLYMAPFADPYFGAGKERRPTCRLDLDDHESRTRNRLAAVHAAAGDEDSAAIERSEAEKFQAMERRYLPLFDRVYVCADQDRRAVATEYGCGHVAVIPNGVRIPTARPVLKPPGAPFTFLFVGNLGYYPNEDAVVFFCSEILARIRTQGSRAVRAVIVGTHPTSRVLGLSSHSRVTVTGAVADLTESYRDADVVVAPIRAGGGSRIKLLEAFSYRRPVVSTTIGAEGIDVRHGTHLLLADTPDDFAAECTRLMTNAALGRDLARRAFELVATNHSPQRIAELLREDHRAAGQHPPGNRPVGTTAEAATKIVALRARRARAERPGAPPPTGPRAG
jgi:glycosyltransferase involved in cell wall biosynthesis